MKITLVKAIFFFFSILQIYSLSAVPQAFIWLNDSLLVMNDRRSEQTYLCKNGTLSLISVKKTSDNQVVNFTNTNQDIIINDEPTSISKKITRVNATERTSAYWNLDIKGVFPAFELVRSLRIYDDAPGVEWRLAVKGANKIFPDKVTHDIGMIENPTALSSRTPHYFFLPFHNRHFTTQIVSFKEATDHHSNVVRTISEIPYFRPQHYQGNLLLAENRENKSAHLIVKLSPIQNAQSAYVGFDFSTDFNGVKVFSPGLDPNYVSSSELQEAYPLFVLMFADNEDDALNIFKKYELAVHKYIPGKDNTFTMNTWGDRNRDSRVNENFILKELETASKLGVTHYQIDDGWQQGLSHNSSSKAGLLWDDWKKEDWKVHAVRFPAGLKKISEKADNLNIKLGLWFNPSKNDNYAKWKRDKEIILDLHKNQNIAWIKIDGLQIGNKEAENNVYNMLQGALDDSSGDLQFNMDVTAGRRGGYFYFNKFGNTFLENRYTDWGNYYPHLTLRNIWQLSKYVPIQRFQIEWLNKWRNDDKYPSNDPLKPQVLPFDYQFAITMVGQPLAWMEATGLPDEAFDVVPLVNSWKKERSQLQSGTIVPIGEMPDGYSFPGFAGYSNNKIYVILFRENTKDSTSVYRLPFGDVGNKKFVKLGGKGILKNARSNELEIQYDSPFQYLWGYFE